MCSAINVDLEILQPYWYNFLVYKTVSTTIHLFQLPHSCGTRVPRYFYHVIIGHD
jgi:hypothetical protein